uniref:Lamin n=1 Tax=Caenorhabditis tropicalis TaxID=1561998 RepID=A0A1I7UY81_9PELO
MSTTRKGNRSSRIVTLERSVNSSLSNGGGDESFGSTTLETSRLQEKDHLTSLNSRLATYIDKVRQLEQENNRLQVQIRDIEVVEKKEKSNLADRFEAEKARLRRALDLAQDELAKYKIEYDAAKVEVKKLKPQVDKLERELAGAEEQALHAQSIADQSQAKQKTLQARNDKLVLENDDLKKQNITLRETVDGLKKAVEDETLLRTAANNKIKALEEDLAFALQQHKGELEEVRHKRQVDMTTYAKQINDEYQSKLQDQIAEMRAQFQSNLAQNKAAFEDAYKNKLNDARERQEAAVSEALHLRARVRDLETSSSGNASLIDRLRSELEALKRSFQEKLDDKDARISELNQEIERMMSEFHDLLDVKIQLDAELKTYQALLEGEEERLNLTQDASRNTSVHHVSFSSGGASAQRGVKRRRVVDVNAEEQDIDYLNRRSKLNKETIGPVGIDEVDEEGKWVRVANNSDEEQAIGGYKLVVKAGNKEASFQFSTRMKLSAHASATVWSADSGAVHNPPVVYVMKKQQWPIGENPSARLEDNEGDTVSSITVELSESSDPSDPADRCSIM